MEQITLNSRTVIKILLYFFTSVLVSSVKNEFLLSVFNLSENIIITHIAAHLSSIISIIIDFCIKCSILLLSYFVINFICSSCSIDLYINSDLNYFFTVLFLGEILRLFLVFFFLNAETLDISFYANSNLESLVFFSYNSILNYDFVYMATFLLAYTMWNESNSKRMAILFGLVSMVLFSIYLLISGVM